MIKSYHPMINCYHPVAKSCHMMTKNYHLMTKECVEMLKSHLPVPQTLRLEDSVTLDTVMREGVSERVMRRIVRQGSFPAKVGGEDGLRYVLITYLLFTDPFKEHLDHVLSPEEVASLKASDSSPSPPSHMPPLGLVSWRPGLPGRQPHPYFHSCSLSELHVCTCKHTRYIYMYLLVLGIHLHIGQAKTG